MHCFVKYNKDDLVCGAVTASCHVTACVPQCVRRRITLMKMKTRIMSRGSLTLKPKRSVSDYRRPAGTYCCSKHSSRFLQSLKLNLMYNELVKIWTNSLKLGHFA